MCVSPGAPKKPEYGPCCERHGGITLGNINSIHLYANTFSATANDSTTTSAIWTDAGGTTTTTGYLTIV